MSDHISGIDDPELEALISAWLDGRLNDDDSAALQERLRESPAARELFLKYSQLDSSMRQLADVDANVLEQLVPQQEGPPTNRSIGWMTPWIAALATCAALLIVVTSLMMSSPEPPIATIAGLSGPFRWTGDGGRVSHSLAIGQPLTGGTIDGLSPESWVELEFEDGSSVTVSGNSMLTFADDGQKVLHLKSGKLSANVEKQPDQHPMLVHTRSATLTVLGTSFGVDAELPATRVHVSEGTVRVERTSDGKVVEVPAKHRVVAAADRDFERTVVPDYVYQWKSRIDLGPDEPFGEWIPASDKQPAMLKSVAFVPEEAPSVVLYLLGMAVDSDDESPVMFSQTSSFRLQGQLNIETDLYLGFWVTKEDGEFAGKFLAKCHVERDDSRGFIANAKFADFGIDPTMVAYQHKLPASPEGLIVRGIWCFTAGKTPTGLAVSQVELIP